MKLLNSKSILDCDENEEDMHYEEINDYLQSLFSKGDYECAVLIKSFDEIHKNSDPVIKSCMLHNCQEMLEYVDIKNGVDIADVDGYFTFLTYGQCYEINGQQHMIMQGIQIRPFNNKREFIALTDLKK